MHLLNLVEPRLFRLQAPRPRKRTAQVLDEDVYTDTIERIIERDYFPDLPKLRNKLDWLLAVNSGAHSRPFFIYFLWHGFPRHLCSFPHPSPTGTNSCHKLP